MLPGGSKHRKSHWGADPPELVKKIFALKSHSSGEEEGMRGRKKEKIKSGLISIPTTE